MFTFIKIIKEKLTLKLEKFKNYFSNEPFLSKVFIIITILFYIDFTIFSIHNMYKFIEYKVEIQEWENFKKLEKMSVSDSEKKSNDKMEELLSNFNSDKIIPFEKIFDNEILLSNTKKIELHTNESFYVYGVVYFSNGEKYRTTSRPISSLINNIEKKINEAGIEYTWGTEAEFKNKKNIKQKPEFVLEEFLILPFISQHFFMFAILLVLLYSIEKQGGFNFNKKFELIFPEDVKGSEDELIGMEDIKNDIFQLKDLIYNKSKYADFGIDKTFNILFSGPPGTGKTVLASLLAKSLNIPMIIGTGNVETGYVAGGANTLKELFKNAKLVAEKHPSNSCIVFLDEAQVLLRKRGQSREKWSDDSANELLALLDGVKTNSEVNLIFIAASNFDDSNMEMDDAMERRFKKKIFFRLPNKEERKLIFEFYLSKIKEENKSKDINTHYLSEITSRLSPAKIQTIIEESSLLAIRTNELITTQTIVKSFERITVGETTRKTTDKQQEVRRTIILHELGHFIADFDNKLSKNDTFDLNKIKSDMSILKISSESISKYNALGYVLNSEEDVSIYTKRGLEEEIISLYGGLAAEVHFLNNDSLNTDNITTGSYNDIEKVSKILKKMVIELGMYSSSKINLNILGLKDDNNNLTLINKISENLFNESLEKVKKHEELILFLYKVLEEKWVLTKEELFKEIEDFYYLKEKNNLFI